MDPIISLMSLMGMDLPEPEYAVDRLIPEEAITIVSGTAGSYKSYACLDIAIAVASGEPAFGQFKTRKTGVLYIDEENGLRLLKKRLIELNAKSNLDIYFRSYEGFIVNDDSIERLIWDCKTNNIGMVIFDSFVRVNNIDENKAGDSAAFFRHIRRIVGEGIAIVLIHHNRKPGVNIGNPGNEMRGSSDILASVDSHISLTRKGQRVTVTQTKQRYDMELKPFWLTVNGRGKAVTFEYQGMLQDNDDLEQILEKGVKELLQENEKLSQKELLSKLKTKEVRTNEHSLRNLIRVMVAEKQVSVTSGVGNTKYYKLEKSAGI